MTLGGFREWVTSDEFPEKLRASFIDQEVVIDMSPEEIESHNKVKTEIVGTIHRLNAEFDLGEVFSDRARLSNVVAGLSTEPDGIFVSWASYEAGRVRLVPRKDEPDEYMELEGTPDWVLEVVSRWSGHKDTESLRNAYHRAEIPEYWLIDAQYDNISFQMLRWRRDRYIAVAARDGWTRSTVFGRSFRLVRRKNRVGRWAYTLEVKPA
jgi:Uma2 family endonuclease